MNRAQGARSKSQSGEEVWKIDKDVVTGCGIRIESVIRRRFVGRLEEVHPTNFCGTFLPAPQPNGLS